MIEFTKYKGDSAENKFNGVPKNTKVFVYSGVKYSPEDQNFEYAEGKAGDIDRANIRYLLSELGVSAAIDDMEQVLKNSKYQGKENKMLRKKMFEMQRVNVELCDYIFRNIMLLAWKKYDGIDSDKSVLSPLRIDEIITVVKPIIANLQKIFNNYLDMKWKNALIIGELNYQQNSKILDLEHKTKVMKNAVSKQKHK